MKRWIYWIGYCGTACAGFFVILKKIIVVKSGGMFFIGLLWIWRSIALILNFEYNYGQKLKRRDQIFLSIADGGIGLSWVVLSLTEWSKQLLPILVVSTPFIIASYFIFRPYRKEKS